MARKKTTPSKEPPQTINFDAAKKAQLLAKNAVKLAEFAATALIAAEQLGIKTKPLEHFTLSTALDLATASGHTSVAKFLNKAVKSRSPRKRGLAKDF